MFTDEASLKVSIRQPDPSRFFLFSFRPRAGGLTMRVQRAFRTIVVVCFGFVRAYNLCILMSTTIKSDG